jgi:putative transposase
MIEQPNPLSLSRQCQLLGLSRAALYYRPVAVSDYELELMALIDRQYLRTPFYGSRRMTAWLRTQGQLVNRKRVQRLMGLMGLEVIYQRPRTSRPAAGHRRYPYLLRGLVIERVNQVWAADITYIPMAHGFLYLVAVMDWVSRYVLAWRLSNLLDASFCIEALEEALRQGRPEIFNTDQGSQFTGEDFTGVLGAHGVAISMDGRGRFSDNIFVERLWRSLKFEEVYLKAYQHVAEARHGIAAKAVSINKGIN